MLLYHVYLNLFTLGSPESFKNRLSIIAFSDSALLRTKIVRRSFGDEGTPYTGCIKNGTNVNRS